MTSTELVGPLPKVSFGGGYALRPGGKSWDRNDTVLLTEPLPSDTRDPRYPTCSEHRVACVCREAEHAEDMTESRVTAQIITDAILSRVAGHPTWTWFYGDRGWNFTAGCRCNLCDLVREVHVFIVGGPSPVDYIPAEKRAYQGGAA